MMPISTDAVFATPISRFFVLNSMLIEHSQHRQPILVVLRLRFGLFDGQNVHERNTIGNIFVSNFLFVGVIPLEFRQDIRRQKTEIHRLSGALLALLCH